MDRILVINNGTAGLYGFRNELLRELCKKYKVFILAKDTGNREDLCRMGCKYIPADIDYHGTNPIKELKLLEFYRKTIKTIRPGIVLTYTIKPNIYGGLICSQQKIPYIANITGLGTAVESRSLLQFFSIPLYRLGLRNAYTVFFQNQENLEFMLKKHIVSGRYDLIPGSGVNLDRYRMLDYPQSETINFTFISRVMREKGIDLYLEAAKVIHAKYPNTCFHIYGNCDDQYKSVLKEYDQSDAVVYHGYTTDVIGVHRLSACTVHPSFYPEGMSNVLLESAACGRPVITTDRAGCRETVEDGITGFIVKQKDCQDLIDKIEKFLQLSWEQRREMGYAGRAKVEAQFDRKIVVNRYLEEIQRGLQKDI